MICPLSLRPYKPLPSLLLASVLAATAMPQESPEVGDALGLVRTESGRPVAGARIRFMPDPVTGSAWLPPTTAAAVEGKSDARGRFRFGIPTARGSLLVTHDAGLGAVVPNAAAGAPVPIVLRALGSVEVDGRRPFTAMVQRLRPGLTPSRWSESDAPRARVDLPAGRYLLLIDVDGVRAERAVDIVPGRIETVPPPTPGAGLDLPHSARAELGRWPGIGSQGSDGRTPGLAGPDVLRVTWQLETGISVFTEDWIDPDRAPVLQAPTGRVRRVLVTDALGVPLADAVTHTVTVQPAGPRAAARGAATGTDAGVAVWTAPERAAERQAVVFSAPGHRPRIFAAERLPARVELTRSSPRRFRIEGADGAAAEFARVFVRSSEDPLLDRTAEADARGVVRLRDDPQPGSTLEIRAIGHLTRSAVLPLDGGTDEPVFRLDPGLRIVGRAILDGERPAAGVEVELRDPTATLDVEPRTVISDEAGLFEFRGLPDGLYTLFANTTVDGGATWSGMLRGVQPGRDEWAIVLRNEDPKPPGTRRDG